jgi:hypothetical protein
LVIDDPPMDEIIRSIYGTAEAEADGDDEGEAA